MVVDSVGGKGAARAVVGTRKGREASLEGINSGVEVGKERTRLKNDY